MKRTLTLNQNRDFLRLYRRGTSRVSPVLVSYCTKNRRGRLRIGITATKKVGGAVQRNRAKRVIRAAYAQLEDRIPGGWDIVFVARTRTAHCKMQQVLRTMLQQLSELGVLAAPVPDNQSGEHQR